MLPRIPINFDIASKTSSDNLLVDLQEDAESVRDSYLNDNNVNFDNDRDEIYSSYGRAIDSDSSASSVSKFKMLNGLANRTSHSLHRKADDDESHSSKDKRRKTCQSDDTFKSISINELIKRQKQKCNTSANAGANYICWGCRNGVLSQSLLDTKFDGFEKIAYVVATESATADIDQIVRDIKSIYDDELKYQVAEFLDVQPEEWTEEQIKHHLTKCAIDPGIDQKLLITYWRSLFDTVAENIAFESTTEPNKIIPSINNIKALETITKVIRKLYNENTEKSSLFNPKVTPCNDIKRIKASHINTSVI